MANVKATWTLPVPARDQRPLKHVVLELSADGGVNFTSLGPVSVNGPQEFSLSDVDPGSGYAFRFTVVDVDGKAGSPLVQSFSIDSRAPGQVQNVVISVS